MIKVVIAEDQELIRQSLELILRTRSDIQVVGVARNGLEALSLTRECRPDVVLMDVRMPEMDGVAATRAIKEATPLVKVLILTTFDDDEYIHDALKNGASGYLLKGISVEELAESITRVHRGESLMDPLVTGKLVRMFTQMAQGSTAASAEPTDAFASLATNEIRIVRLIAEGKSNVEIAEQLGFSNGTVRNYISGILEKLELRDRTQLAIMAVRARLGEREE